MDVYLLVIAFGIFANFPGIDTASYLASVHCGSKQVNLSVKLMRMCRRCAEKATDPNIGCARMHEKNRRKCKQFHPNFCAFPTIKTETMRMKTTTDRADHRSKKLKILPSYVGNYCDDEGYSGVRLKLCKTCYRVIIRDGCAQLTDEFLLGCRKADASFCPFQKPTLPTTKVGRIELYHLAPKSSNACDYGTSALQTNCEAAALSLAPNPTRSLVTGSGGTCRNGWGVVPLGCSAQTGGDNTAHYKTYGDTDAGCIHQDYQLVCTEARRHREDGVLEPLRIAVIVISVAVVLLSVVVITVAVVCRRRRRFTNRETLI